MKTIYKTIEESTLTEFDTRSNSLSKEGYSPVFGMIIRSNQYKIDSKQHQVTYIQQWMKVEN